MAVDARYIVNSDVIVTDNTCYICYDDMNNDRHELECSHSFHNGCLISWFRTGNSSCPYCRSLNKRKDNFFGGGFKFNRQFSKRKEAPECLKKMVAKLQKKEQQIKNHKKALIDWKKTKEGKSWKKLNKVYRKLKSATRNRAHSRHISQLREEIAAFPIIPVPVSKIKRK